MTPDPTVLAFDTSGEYCSAALLQGGAVVSARHIDMARGQAERLMGLLGEVLSDAGVGWADLDRIGVGIGPGNFTGIRISISAARGLSMGLGIPAIGVSLLDALDVGASGPVLACLTAPQNKAYVQGHRMKTELPPQIIALDDVSHDWVEPGLSCIGSAATALSERLGCNVAPAADAPGSAIARHAATAPLVPGARPSPLYLKPADAAPSKERGPVMLP